MPQRVLERNATWYPAPTYLVLTESHPRAGYSYKVRIYVTFAGGLLHEIPVPLKDITTTQCESYA